MGLCVNIPFFDSFVIAIASAVSLVSASVTLAQEKEVFGWVEKIGVKEAGFAMQAKLDSGADSSSVHATRVEEFTKKGVQWVRFKVRSTVGEVATVERPVERVALIKRHFGKSERRIVVRLGLCLGDIFQEEDVNLVDRTKFDYRLLLGRSFLVGNAIIDPAMMFTSQPTCVARTSKSKDKDVDESDAGEAVTSATNKPVTPQPKLTIKK